MFCKNCGKEILTTQQEFCSNCGTSLANKQSSTVNKHGSWSKKIAGILLILFFIGVGIYNSLDEDVVIKNNEGLSSFDAGDSQGAIEQFQQASQEAVTNENKINTLKNLAYVYASEEHKDAQALATFKEALALTSSESFDYYLISGEIALLENKPNAAILSFKKAYEMNPKDFQVNNSLAIFYLDLDTLYPQYEDYPKSLFHAKEAFEYDIDKTEISRQNLALAYYFNENFSEAISLLSSTNYSQHPYAAFWRGLAHLSLEDHTDAKKYLQIAVDGGVELPQNIHDYLYAE